MNKDFSQAKEEKSDVVLYTIYTHTYSYYKK